MADIDRAHRGGHEPGAEPRDLAPQRVGLGWKLAEDLLERLEQLTLAFGLEDLRRQPRRSTGEIDDLGGLIVAGDRPSSPALFGVKGRRGLTAVSAFPEVEHSEDSISGDDRDAQQL